MKNLIVFWLHLSLPFFVWAQNSDTIIGNVHVGFLYSKEIFPQSWQGGSINAAGQQIDRKEIPRSKSIIAKALSKYPGSILSSNLKAVYFLKEMMFYDVGFGGTNSSDAVYITNEGLSLGYTDRFVEQSFHHEFSSILFRTHPSFIDTSAWKDANVAGFIYNDPEDGVGAIRNKQSSQLLNTLFCGKGLLTQYSASSLENDVNTFAQNLFSPEKDFWNYVDRFRGIKKKADLLINFYNRLNSAFTETYFRKMDKQ